MISFFESTKKGWHELSASARRAMLTRAVLCGLQPAIVITHIALRGWLWTLVFVPLFLVLGYALYDMVMITGLGVERERVSRKEYMLLVASNICGLVVATFLTSILMALAALPDFLNRLVSVTLVMISVSHLCCGLIAWFALDFLRAGMKTIYR